MEVNSDFQELLPIPIESQSNARKVKCEVVGDDDFEVLTGTYRIDYRQAPISWNINYI